MRQVTGFDLMQWILCALWMLVTAAGGFFISHASAQIDNLWSKHSELQAHVANMDALVADSKDRSLEMKHDIEIINGKLDTLLARSSLSR